MKFITRISIGYALLAALVVLLLFCLFLETQRIGSSDPQLTASLFWLRVAQTVAGASLVACVIWWILVSRFFARRLQQIQRRPYPLNNSRDDEFTPVIAELNQMASQLEAVANAKSSFFSHAAHELKGPLASMRESTQLLLDARQEPLTPTQKKILEIQLRANTQLFTIVNNLADLSRIEARALDYLMEAHDLSAIVKTFITEHPTKLVHVQLNLPEAPLLVNGDALRLSQAISQLVDNAVKFSPKGGIIQINGHFFEELPALLPQEVLQKLRQTKISHGFARIEVTDQGSGVPDLKKEMIFQKFYQGSNESKTYNKGLGIGLTLCRHIIEDHYGAVWVEDHPEGGSRFIVILPCTPGKSKASHSTPGS